MYLLALCLMLLVPLEQEFLFEIQQGPENSVVIEGTFMGYSLGDYYHAAFTDENGNLFTAWAPTARTPGLSNYLFQHRGEVVKITVVNVLTNIPEAGDIVCAFVMDARTDEDTYQGWYASVLGEFGISAQQEFDDHFGAAELEEPLFVEHEYLEETGGEYRNIIN